MPSIRSLLFSTFATAQTVLGLTSLTSPVYRLNASDSSASASCPHPQLSCHNTTVVENLCCFNAPGGSLLQTQFWDTDPSAGPSDSWTIHGLWPDNCDGTYPSNCDPSRAYKNISAILQSSGNSALLAYMRKYWVSDEGSDESFWEHEWGKHGTCISTLDPQCYTNYEPTEEVPAFFQRVVSLFKTLPTYDWLKEAGIVPSTSKTYSSASIQKALSAKHGGSVYLGCYNGALSEVWYYFNVRGSLQTGQFVASPNIGGSSSCPASGIKYPPKGSSGGGGGGDGGSSQSSSPSGTSTSSSPSSTPTGPSFSGNGYLNVITSGSKKGCIISYGTWYTTGTCATFSATASDEGFTLKSSKGNCAVKNGKLLCGSDVSSPTTFTAEGSSLAYGGRTTFSAESIPTGSDQGTVFMGKKPGEHPVGLGIEWQSV